MLSTELIILGSETQHGQEAIAAWKAGRISKASLKRSLKKAGKLAKLANKQRVIDDTQDVDFSEE